MCHTPSLTRPPLCLSLCCRGCLPRVNFTKYSHLGAGGTRTWAIFREHACVGGPATSGAGVASQASSRAYTTSRVQPAYSGSHYRYTNPPNDRYRYTQLYAHTYNARKHARTHTHARTLVSKTTRRLLACISCRLLRAPVQRTMTVYNRSESLVNRCHLRNALSACPVFH